MPFNPTCFFFLFLIDASESSHFGSYVMPNAQVKMWVWPIRQQTVRECSECARCLPRLLGLSLTQIGSSTKWHTKKKKKKWGTGWYQLKRIVNCSECHSRPTRAEKCSTNPDSVFIHLQLTLGNSCHDWASGQPCASYPDQPCVTADLGRRRRAKKDGSPLPS